jgi:hypothetical protein
MTDLELDPYIEWIAHEARRPVFTGTEARARLIEALALEPAPATDVTAWKPRVHSSDVVLTPLKFAALAAGLVAFGVLLGRGHGTGRDSQPTGQPQVVAARTSQLPASDTVFTFVFVAPAAAQVAVVGDFNQWNAEATPMTRIGDTDAWTASVPMSPGRHIYSFFTVGQDGERWIADPHAPAAPDDGFGRANSVLIVGRGSAS